MNLQLVNVLVVAALATAMGASPARADGQEGPVDSDGLLAQTGSTAEFEAASGSDDGIEEIMVTGRQRSAARDVIIERIEQPVITDIVGAEQISRVGDSTAALALRRLPGVSLVGDFVYIRGLGERYSSTTLNGALVPSPDLTRNVIPLDIFPAEIIESISIQKGYTVDRPAAFGGGNIDIRTRQRPDELTMKLQVGTGWNSNSSRDTLTYKGGSDDWLGTDDGTRALPGEISNAIQTYRGSITPAAIFNTLRLDGGNPTFAEAEAINRQLATSLNRSIDITTQSTDPDLSLEGSLGNSWVLDEAGNWTFGVIGIADYKNQWRNRTRITRSQQLPELDNGLTNRSIQQVSLTGSVSAGLDFMADHSVGVTGIYLRNTEDEAAITTRNNFNFRREQGAQLRDYRIRYEERELELIQFSGRHAVGDDTVAMLGDWAAFPLIKDLELTWYYSDATANTDIPNEVSVSAVDAIDPTTGEVLRTSLRLTSSAADYRFTQLEDQVTSYGGQLTRPFDFRNGTLRGHIFGGGDSFEKGRIYLQTQLGLGTTQSAASPILTGTPGQVLTDANILDPANGFLLSLGGIGTESYLAGETIQAGYGGFDVTWNETWRLSGGVRYENWNQVSVPVDPLEFGIGTGDNTIPKIPIPLDELTSVAKQVDDWFPSAALTWIRPDFWAEEFQLRFGFSQTTARPDLREVTQSAYLDPFTDARVIGNPTLVPSDIRNFDIRAEWFFANRDNLTISPFYKRIDKPIETVEGAGTDNTLSFTFINADRAELYGVEFEWFKDLAFSERWLGGWATGLFTTGNVTWTESDLKVGSSSFALTNESRPLNQQSDLILNLQFGYDSPGGAHSAALVYNRFSERLFFAGRNGAPDAFEQPFESLDLVYTWYPADRWSLKLRLQNLLEDNLEITQGGTTILEQDIGVTYKVDLTYGF